MRGPKLFTLPILRHLKGLLASAAFEVVERCSHRSEFRERVARMAGCGLAATRSRAYLSAMRTISCVLVGAFLLLASSACAQFASGMAGGRGGGGGLYGVTRRTYMGVPNVAAARYFQNSGLPLVNLNNLDAIDSPGGRLAANRPGAAAPRPAQSPRRVATLAKQVGVPLDPSVALPGLPRSGVLARNRR